MFYQTSYNHLLTPDTRKFGELIQSVWTMIRKQRLRKDLLYIF